MKFDTTTVILLVLGVIVGVAYFARRRARIKRENRQRPKL